MAGIGDVKGKAQNVAGNVKNKVKVVADKLNGAKKKIKFAPLDTPWERRMQTLAVVSFWWYGIGSIVLFTIFLFPAFWWITIPYLIFMVLDRAPGNGGRKSEWLRNMKVFRRMRDYFPLTLVKEGELDPTNNYIFGYHPHGIISMGAFISFGTEAAGFSEVFPGIDLSLCTLSSNFRIPFFRDLLMGLGLISVSKKSIFSKLRKGPGNSVAIVIGGAAESLNAHPKTANLTLKNRKGFVKLALETGAHLVPVFGFGENEIFRQLNNAPGTDLREKQESFMRQFGFTFPVFHGRGVFQYNFGFVPVRKALTIIVGKPIQVPKAENITEDLLNEYHTKYLNAIKEIYDRYKDDLAVDRRQEVKFI